jgi:two-component system, NarL family, nitrate/nitrite response regulator NarL
VGGLTVIGSRRLLRSGLVSLLSTIGFNPIEECDDCEHLEDSIGAKQNTEVLIVCLIRGAEDVTKTMDRIKAWAPDARTVFVVPQLDVTLMSDCFAAGAFGFLLESISCDALGESLRLVGSGEKVFPSQLALLFPMLASRLASPQTHDLAPPESRLSHRELEILRSLTSGHSNKVIAKNLKIAEATVKVHVKRILRKAHVMNRTQAAMWGVANGVVLTPVAKSNESTAS